MRHASAQHLSNYGAPCLPVTLMKRTTPDDDAAYEEQSLHCILEILVLAQLNAPIRQCIAHVATEGLSVCEK